MKLWDAVDALLAGAPEDGIFFHGLGPLAARRAAHGGTPVSAAVAREGRAALLTAAMAEQLVRRVRESCSGPIVLFKGLEVASLYPARARRFADIDLLAPNAEAVQGSLIDAGFVVDPDGLAAPDYHLSPLLWPSSPLQIEVHARLNWPTYLRAPRLEEIVEAACPSATGIDGILAPRRVHHALLLAAHSCEHRPLRTLRDLIDIAAVAAEADREEIERTAAAWGLRHIWRTTRSTIDALFDGARRPIPLRTWARHLPRVREPTVLESHLERLASPYWCMPVDRATGRALRAAGEAVTRSDGETWGEKVGRSVAALRHATVAVGQHEASVVAPSGGHRGRRDDPGF